MANSFNGILRLRRDLESNYEAVKDIFILKNGEIALVDTIDYGLRYKVGDGVSTYAQLPFADAFINKGYLYDGEFYVDTNHKIKYIKYENKFYIDISNQDELKTYIYEDGSYKLIAYAPSKADAEKAGIMKLYNTSGQNEDGTMTQKAITDGVNSIKLILSPDDNECLELDLPWD